MIMVVKSILFCLFYLLMLQRIEARHINYIDILRLLARRHGYSRGTDSILGVPSRPEFLPKAEPILPAHTLLRPSPGMLRSAIKFPHKDTSLVYGNLDNVGIKNRYGEYVLNTGFRRANADQLLTNWLNSIIKAAEKVDRDELHKKSTDILIFGVRQPEASVDERPLQLSESSEEESNLGAEIFDIDSRRKTLRDNFYEDNLMFMRQGDAKTSSDSADYERNPGNPFTVKKNRYHQNWPWNFEMDGDHMNINPHAPTFDGSPNGGEFFLARKWWYYNQDDFVPF